VGFDDPLLLGRIERSERSKQKRQGGSDRQLHFLIKIGRMDRLIF
jgi:hypothetical protein